MITAPAPGVTPVARVAKANTEPNTWVGKPLGALHYVARDGRTVSQELQVQPLGADPGRTFVPVRSFVEGRRLATSFATDMEGYFAHAVLQAADGAHFVAMLGSPAREGVLRNVVIDGEQYDASGYRSVRATRASPALLAVVGGERMLDLRTQPVETPAGPKVVVRDEHGKIIGAQG